MAKKEYHAEQTETPTLFSLIPSEFITMGRQHIHECVKAHSELLDRFQEANRSWLDHLQSEADLSAEFTSKMIAARSTAGRCNGPSRMEPPAYGNGEGRCQACPC